MIKTLFSVLLASIALYANAASFDCTKASTYAEKQVCSDILLSKLDDALAQNYKSMQVDEIGIGALKDLRKTQKEWVQQRNKCTTKSCLVNSYKQRIDEVCEYPVIEGVHPICISSDDI